MTDPPPPRCLTPAPLAVAFVGHSHDLRTFESYQSGKGYLGSETYWSSSIHYVLRSLNVTVDVYPTRPLAYDARVGGPKNNSLMADLAELKRASLQRPYHRLVLAGYPAARFPLLTRLLEPSLLCRTRIAAWWDVGVASTVGERGGFDKDLSSEPAVAGEREASAAAHEPVDPRLVLTPHANDLGSPIPYFAHSTVTLPPSTDATGRGRNGFLLGKSCLLLNRNPHVIQSLLAAGFTLHSTASCAHLWPSVRYHGMMAPREFALLLRRMAFLVGVGAVAVSPSPLEALANGAAYLNPRNQTPSPGRAGGVASSGGAPAKAYRYQHPILAGVGAPYVYSYDVDQPESLVAAAERATRVRFASFVPQQHRLETAIASACANFIDHDAPCACMAARAMGDSAFPACRRAVPPSALAALVTSTDDGSTTVLGAIR